MSDFLRALGKAATGILHPRMLWLTFMPFVVATAGWGVFFWFMWQPLVGAARAWLAASWLGGALDHAFDWVGLSALHTALGPFLVIVLSIPLIVTTVLLLIATISMPLVVRHLSLRRFA